MKRIIYALIALLTITALLVIGGCSDDLSTSPDVSSDGLNQKLAGARDLLIGYSGVRPDADLEAAGAVIKQEFKYIPVVLATVPDGSINSLKAKKGVLFAEEPMYRDHCAQVLDWGVNRIDGEYVHATSSYDGSGINVAVLDSGGDMDHPDITWAGGYSCTNSDVNYWEDKMGHGTHCAGIISADDNDIGVVGVAPNCSIYMVQVGRRRLAVTDIIEGIDWCIASWYDADPDNNIQIISMSFSGGGSAAEETALIEAYGTGILCIAAAGNYSTDVSSYAPATYDCVMAVSASDPNDAAASFTNYGSEIELIAPGVSIYSTYKRGRYATMSGTSMACPEVVGAAALAWSAHPTYTNVQMRSLLNGTAEDIGLNAIYQGNGLVDAENATLGTTSGNNY